MARLLIAYSSIDGHTRHICERLLALTQTQGHTVTLLPIEQVGAAQLRAADKFVLGASIRYGRHRPQVLAFAHEHVAVLARLPSAFFTVNVVARKPNRNRPDTNPYLRKFLRQVPWRPTELDVFAGRVDYPRMGPLDRLMIRFIMWLTHGPTDPKAVVEFTDWVRVAAFAERVGRM
jgi:menaquinone-dependent protoporphyrinogen oxidase